MPFPRPRLTVRRLMIAVAVVAVILWSAQTRRLWLNYRDRHDAHALMEKLYLEEAGEIFDMVQGGETFGMVQKDTPTPEELREFNSRAWAWHLGQASHYASLKRKYARAMSRPWLPVEPDPPIPE